MITNASVWCGVGLLVASAGIAVAAVAGSLIAGSGIASVGIASAGLISAASGGWDDPSKPNPLNHPAPDYRIEPVPQGPAAPKMPPPTRAVPVFDLPDDPIVAAAKAEGPYLKGHRQLTFPARFFKAGEAYFEAGGTPRWIIFQAIERPRAGADGVVPEAETNYAMYIAKLKRDGEKNDGAIMGLEEPLLISPPNSANTCGWFHPTEAGRVLFGSTVIKPSSEETPGYSRDRKLYSWQFPTEMRVVTTVSEAMRLDKFVQQSAADPSGKNIMRSPTASPTDAGKVGELLTLPNGPGYAAECSWSKDGRFVLFTYRDPKTSNPDIWVHDTTTNKSTALITARGYNGGPFFSPDGKAIVYRSDRRGDSNLQLFASTLAYDAAGAITGIAAETQMTDDANVSWAPYFHPGGQYVIYASSAIGHSNYEVFAMKFDLAKKPSEQVIARVTTAPGFDGLPAFSDDGKVMMWTSQRGGKIDGEQRPSSQLWVAEVGGEPVWGWVNGQISK